MDAHVELEALSLASGVSGLAVVASPRPGPRTATARRRARSPRRPERPRLAQFRVARPLFPLHHSLALVERSRKSSGHAVESPVLHSAPARLAAVGPRRWRAGCWACLNNLQLFGKL